MLALGVQTWGTDIAALRRYWRAADRLGFTRITYGDGLWSWTHDGWTMLAALAAETRTARIGPAVTYAFDPACHHPAWLAKRAVTVDHLSGGRLDLRLGVGAEDPATAAAWTSQAIVYPPAGQRVAHLDESVAIVRALLRGETVTRQGRFYRFDQARLQPLPLQSGGPPIWIAAMRPRALEVVAQQADGWEASYLSPQTFAARWAFVRSRLQAHGRAADEVARSVEVDVVLTTPGRVVQASAAYRASRGVGPEHPLMAMALLGDARAVIERIGAYAAAGATDLMLAFADFPATTMLERFAAEVLPTVSAPINRGGRRPGRNR
jgi:alkanesulfonate monooxygenase SsuD/methylene tetrahydromethanopterin reductase-like flavin-dependent oxidoreductase (luciferase family)